MPPQQIDPSDPSSRFVHMPDFSSMKPVGVVYTNSLNVPNHECAGGIPGVVSRDEWYAIDYHGAFWLPDEGHYRFAMTSDDGSKLYIDGRVVIDNDGLHTVQTQTGKVSLRPGAHSIRVSYFQGLRAYVALVLEIAGPGEKFRVFDTREFSRRI
jgi:hypothetical protein